MRLIPLFVGVENIPILRFQNVAERFFARDTGSPSEPAEIGYLSTSSQSTIRMGREARELGELAPQEVM